MTPSERDVERARAIVKLRVPALPGIGPAARLSIENAVASASAEARAEGDAAGYARGFAAGRDEERKALLNTPEVSDFARGVVLESQHQAERWGREHDDSKEPETWFWVLGYLAGKVLAALKAGDLDKARHHTISSAALLAHWHGRLTAAIRSRSGGESPAARFTEGDFAAYLDAAECGGTGKSTDSPAGGEPPKERA